jgi:hypothetical protein
MNTNNSISNAIKQLLEINVNSLKTFERINEAVTTDEKNVPLEILTPDGTKTVHVPSFGFMKRELERLDTNLKALSGLGTGGTRVKLADGSYQTVITSTLKTPAKDVTSLARPISFGTKSNYFFEDFLNPLMTINLDVTGQVPIETEQVLVKRYIFDSTSPLSVDYFNENYRNESNIDYATVVANLTNENIPHLIDEEVRMMPYRTIQYTGRFDVLSIADSQKDVIVNGVTQKKTVKLYTLDKLTYTDSAKFLKETEVLKVGDELIVNSENRNTRYKIAKVDGATRQVELELVEGYEPIRIGAAILAVYKNPEANLSVELNVGFNERMLVFVKPIDPISKMTAENWSPGVGLYSNELVYLKPDGNATTLADFYRDEVADFGRFIKSLKDDSIPPSTQGVQPDAPLLNPTNFSVVQINKHMTDSDAANKIKKLSADKVSSEETIKKLDDTIYKKRTEVATKKYSSTIEADKDKSELSTLIEQRTAEASLYGSIVNQIQSLSTDTNVTNVTPKYRVRGFWTVPAAKQVAETIDQQVVQFVVQYRYISTSGKSPEVTQIPFTETATEKTAIFSNWNEMKTNVRDRARNEMGKFVWLDPSVEDGQAVNFNQLDIAINQGESVEIRIKSVSEAGFPANPIMSDWSAPIRIDFPVGQVDTTDLQALVNKNIAEAAKVQLTDELLARGVYNHVEGSFTANEKYYAHTALDIASGFLSGEQKPISVFDKIAELQQQILSLQEQIAAAKGELLVKLIDDTGTVTMIQNNTVNQIFAGYYTDEVAELTVKKGHIVTKTFKLVLENTKATTLELIARISGDRSAPAYKSLGATATETINGFGNPLNDKGTIAVDGKIAGDTYYTTEGNYDLVPVQYQNLSANELTTLDLVHELPYQSAQRRGQFINSRYMDVSNKEALYIVEPMVTGVSSLTEYEYGLSYAGWLQQPPILLIADDNANSTNFIWAGTFGRHTAVNSEPYDLSAGFNRSLVDVVSLNTVGSANYNAGIYMHKEHPDLEGLFTDYSNNAVALSAITDQEMQASVKALIDNAIYTMPIPATIETGGVYSIYDPNNIGSSNAIAKKQLGFMQMNGMIAAGDRSFKMSFDANDQYLLGGRSCGAFLFLAPTNINTFSVDGDNKQGSKKIFYGENNSVAVDVVFQYRMTDYAGNDPATDTGRIAGQTGLGITNLTYTKVIGIDIFDKYDAQFSFDLEVFARYSAKGKNLNSVRAAQLVR